MIIRILSNLLVLSCLLKSCFSEECHDNHDDPPEPWNPTPEEHIIEEKTVSCECCIAVSHVLHATFDSAHKNLPDTGKRLAYTDIVDITEMTCDPRNQRFDVYGLRDGKDGSHRLTGPGLVGGAGVAHMGGKTPTRLSDSCEMYLEADEMAIYEVWIRGNKVPDAIKEYLCKNPQRTNVPKSVSEELDLSACLKDGVKHIADEL